SGSNGLGTAKKHGPKMKVTKNKTARNLYAHMYMKIHPSTTPVDFDKVWKGLSDDTLQVHLLPSLICYYQEYNALRQYALLCEHESLDTIANGWQNMPQEERENYYIETAMPKDRKGKGKAR
ncbi:hypothetical protein C8Q77DRAFT_1059470, partial [Trametes polyzona]